jgi:hypothetical protein
VRVHIRDVPASSASGCEVAAEDSKHRMPSMSSQTNAETSTLLPVKGSRMDGGHAEASPDCVIPHHHVAVLTGEAAARPGSAPVAMLASALPRLARPVTAPDSYTGMATPTRSAHHQVGSHCSMRACKRHVGARLQGLPSAWESVPALDHQLWQRHHSVEFGLPEEDAAHSVPEELSSRPSSSPAELAQVQTGRSRPAPETSAWHLNVTSALCATFSPCMCFFVVHIAAGVD